jgi:hypothetical protein
MSAAYLEADLGALHRLAELVEQLARGMLPVSGHSAIQQLEDRFGLSPRSRQLLQWQVLAAGEAPSSAAPAPLPTASSSSNVRRLRAVDPKAAGRA